MTYLCRTTVAFVLVSLVFFVTACSDQNQAFVPTAVLTASGKILEKNRKRGLETGAWEPSAPGSVKVVGREVKKDHEFQREPVRFFIEDREKKRMGLLVLILMGAVK